MRISELLKQEKATFSMEVFPPKTSEKFTETAENARKIAALGPDFMSVTYGAGGGTGAFTTEIAAGIQREFGVPTLAHLTCVSSGREHVREMLRLYRENGIENILALRGDIPAEGPMSTDYRYAAELIREIRELGDFCVGGACYPEGHVECAHKEDDLRHLKEKVDAGMDFLITQMFFDNPVFYSYMYKLREAGVTVPVHPGIMPIVNARQMKRTLKLSGTTLPERFRRILDTFGDTPVAMRQAGIAYATDQIIDLFANGIPSVHVYSMNNPGVAKAILENLSDILD